MEMETHRSILLPRAVIFPPFRLVQNPTGRCLEWVKQKCIQAVLIFEANYNSVNKSGETAWDIILKQHQSKIYNNMDKGSHFNF